MNKKYTYIILGIAGVFLVGAVLIMQNTLPFIAQAYVSTDVGGLPEVRPTETVELSDGATYDMTAGYVRKNMGGTEYRMLAYNGSIPGPLLKMPQGAEVTINFKNDTDVPTLLHSHGVRMDNAFDGAQTSQEEMKPGQSFSYKLKFPDAGVYWYHPHVKEDFQQELGLYGNYLVEPADSDYWSPVNREIPLFLDDILIENNQILLSKTETDRTLMGRFGNVMLINGETSYSLSVKRGETIRFFVTNSANTRPFIFSIEGTKMKLAGGDGGAQEKDQWVGAVRIGPSERVIVEVLFENSGTFAIQNITSQKAYTLGTIKVSADSVSPSYVSQFNQLKTHTQTVRSVDAMRPYFDTVPDKQIVLTLDMGGEMMQMQGMGHGDHMMSAGQMMGGSMSMETSSGGIEEEDTNPAMNQMSDTDSIKWKMVDKATGKENMDINWIFKKGEPVKIRIENTLSSMHPMQHPIHFHGQQFLVVAINGVRQDNLVWKDTVFVPSGQTVDIILNPTNPGTWMAHCHIAEHLTDGMMMRFEVR